MEYELLPVERQRKILALLQAQKKVRVADLSDSLQVSSLTIRRDLASMEEDGLLERSHGGAVLPERKITELYYEEKQDSFANEKRDIGIKAATFVKDGETVFINSGSTTKEVIRALNGRNVRIITTNLVAMSVVSSELTEVVIIGGMVRKKSMSTVGQMSLSQLANYHADKAILGFDAFSAIAGFTAPLEIEADQSKVMIEQTVGDVIMVADHSKLGLVSTFKVANLRAISHFITDKASEEHLEPASFEEAGVVFELV